MPLSVSDLLKMLDEQSCVEVAEVHKCFAESYRQLFRLNL